jgi:hypothetical protein
MFKPIFIFAFTAAYMGSNQPLLTRSKIFIGLDRCKLMEIDRQPENQNLNEKIPEYLKRWAGLYIRQGNQLIEAPVDDQLLAQSYPQWLNKGTILDGKRLTLLTKKKVYQVNEPIRVIHVVEVTKPGYEVYIMGPKAIYGEYVNGQLVTSQPPSGKDPLVPQLYDGKTLLSPAVDYNYEITTYSFPKPGIHRIYWQLGTMRSNILILEIVN